MNRYLLILLILVSTSVFGQEEKQESPFSHRGLKAAIGLGGFENEFGQTFEDGDGRILNLGYGIDDRFSLWLGAVLAEHPPQHVKQHILLVAKSICNINLSLTRLGSRTEKWESESTQFRRIIQA